MIPHYKFMSGKHVLLFKLSLSIALTWQLTACQVFEDLVLGTTEEEKIEREIELERKRLELERLRQTQTPSPTPTPVASATITPEGPVNQNPQIKVLDAVLGTTVKNNDTVRIIAEGFDADGDTLEYIWSSVYKGLSSTKGQEVVWHPETQVLAGKTNIITLTITDKQGGSSTASLNIYIQSDGTLLVREDTLNLPVLRALTATKTTDGDIYLRTSATDPSGGILRYKWQSSQGQLSRKQSANTLWQADGATGPISIELTISNNQNLQTTGKFEFQRNAAGQLIGGFTGATFTALPHTQDFVGQDNPELAGFIGRALVFRDEELFLWNPQNASRSLITTLSELKGEATASTMTLQKLYYQSPDKEAWAVFSRHWGYNNEIQVYRIDLETLAIEKISTNDLQAQKDGTSIRIEAPYIYKSQQGIQGFITVYSLNGTKENWLGSPDGKNLKQKLPEGLLIKTVLPNGDLIGAYSYRNNNPRLGHYRVVRYTPTTDSEIELGNTEENPDLITLFKIQHWGHAEEDYLLTEVPEGLNEKGQSYTNGISRHTLDDLLNDHPETLQKFSKGESFGSVQWSLDDIFYSAIKYPFKYIPKYASTEQRQKIGYLTLYSTLDPEWSYTTDLSFSDMQPHQMVWVP